MTDEFERIARCFAPLAHDTAARALLDDAAVWRSEGPFVITTDAIVEGVHFLPDDPIEDIARKAFRVNASDIVAKGAAPCAYVLTLIWPHSRPADQMDAFAAALAEDQKLFGCALLGGDTTATAAGLCISITMFGRPLGDRVPARCDARVGEEIWVSGTIGDAVLGLDLLQGRLKAEPQAAGHFAARYRVPLPRLNLAEAVARYAGASMDVSDGLLGDAAKIAAASGVRLVIDPHRVPLSPAAAAWLETAPDRNAALERLCTGGDDYEILLTAGPTFRRNASAGFTCIGRVEEGAGVDAAGLAVSGFRHAW